jgi:hypothetical protein
VNGAKLDYGKRILLSKSIYCNQWHHASGRSYQRKNGKHLLFLHNIYVLKIINSKYKIICGQTCSVLTILKTSALVSMVDDGLVECFIVAKVTEKAILFIVVLVVEMNRYEVLTGCLRNTSLHYRHTWQRICQ